MPDINLHMTAIAERELAPFREELGKLLRQATVDALPGSMSPGDVAIRFIPHTYSDNATTLQIMGIANHTPEREQKLVEWGIALAKAWQTFATQHNIAWKDDVDVWPTMPVGKWMKASQQGIDTAMKFLFLTST